jgi:threonine dehydrogenase-like Zn-dependent dehydrogenase
MKAIAAFPERRSIELIDTPEPALTAPDHVRMRMLEVGVCGTDREIAAFEYGTPPAGEDHLIMGHESLAEVAELGDAVTDLHAGDLVVPMVRRPCGVVGCTPCEVGRQDFCSTGQFTERGIGGRHGFMTEFVVDERRYLHKVPADLRAIAILVEPLTIAEKGLAQLAQVQQRLPWDGKRAVVLGGGPVGLLGAMALTVRGFATAVYSRSPAPNPSSAVADAIGATYISSMEHAVDELPTLLGAIDVVYEAVGASQLAFETIPQLGPNGVFIFTGVPGRKGPIEIAADTIMRDLVLRNQVALGTVNAGPDAFQGAIADLAEFYRRWPDAVASLITGRHPIEAAPGLLADRGDGIKEVVAIG